MSWAEDPANPYRDYVRRLREGARRADQERIARWRNATPEEHNRVLMDLLDLQERIVRSRGRPVEKEPLPRDGFPWPSMREAKHAPAEPRD